MKLSVPPNNIVKLVFLCRGKIRSFFIEFSDLGATEIVCLAYTIAKIVVVRFTINMSIVTRINSIACDSNDVVCRRATDILIDIHVSRQQQIGPTHQTNWPSEVIQIQYKPMLLLMVVVVVVDECIAMLDR